MRPIKITEDCIIYNDMNKGWIRGKGQPVWHRSLYDRWKNMWKRCKDPKNSKYNNYKNCEIDERYRLFSNYVNDIMLLENFDKLCENPSKWDIDKDKKDPNNRCYFFEHLIILSDVDNTKERNNRQGHPNPPKPVIGINIKNGHILIFDSRNDVKFYNFDPTRVSDCCKGIYSKHKGYKWEYL